MAPKAPSRPSVFACPVDDLSLEEAVGRVSELVAARTPARVGAVNAAKFMMMAEDPALHRAVAGSEVVLPDGVGAVWAIRMLRGRGIARVTGIDLMERLVAEAAARGWSVYFLGAKEEVQVRMLEVLAERHPGLRVAGRHHGYFGPADEPALVEAIRASGADLLFVAMGTPAKELWIDRHFQALGVPVSMGVGGSFDVIAGAVKRAPRWIQNAGLEWFYRFIQEPTRLFHRYFVVSLQFFFKVLAARFRPGAVERP